MTRKNLTAEEMLQCLPAPEDESLFEPRHISEWHEDIGDVLWWTSPVSEPPYCGTPNDCGMTVEMRHYVGGEGEVKTISTSVGGWPGYHQWWTPLPDVKRIAENISKLLIEVQHDQ